MASSAPSPASPTTTAPPLSSEVSPPTSQPTQPNANPPESTAFSTPPPPTTSVSPPPSTPSVSPPPSTPSPPPSSTTSPPPSTPSPPPTSTSPPPQTVTPRPAESPPPTTTTSPPPSSPLPPVAVPPPASSPPPPAAAPPPKSSPPPPPPASSTSPEPSPSPPPPPPQNSPPPPSSPSPPPTGSSSPPPPVSPSSPPKSSPPSPPAASPPSSSPPPRSSTPSPPTSFSPPISPVSTLSPPPPSIPQSSPTSPAANSTSSSKSEIPTAGIAAIAGVVGVLVILAVGLVVWFLSKRNRKRKTYEYPCAYVAPSSAFGSSPASDVNLIIKTHAASSYDRSSPGSGNLTPTSPGGYGNSRSFFTYRELYEATDGFAAENLLGEGGFGCVYKGILTDGKEVAVKQLKIGGGQGEREFKAEVESISRIHHRHLVSLVGYCIFESRRLLVYEYVPNKTLYYHLHGEGTPVASWATRIKIAVGTARGIAYLHEDCHPRIIHRDIKSSNILLDNNFEARVSDFGLAKLALDVDTHISTRVMGTFGYMAPEYATTGKLTDKSDVFSFGVVLLELITGRKPVDESQPLGDESLVEWARPLLSNALETGETESLVDPRLEKNYIEGEMLVMIEAAAACVRHSAAKRPRMGQVVRAFENLFPSDLSNGMRVGESKIYDSAQQASDIAWFRKMAFGSQNDFSSDLFSEPSQNFGLSGERRAGEGISSTQRSQNDSSRQQSPNIFSMRQGSYQNLQYSGQSSGQSSTPYVDSSTSGESQIS